MAVVKEHERMRKVASGQPKNVSELQLQVRDVRGGHRRAKDDDVRVGGRRWLIALTLLS